MIWLTEITFNVKKKQYLSSNYVTYTRMTIGCRKFATSNYSKRILHSAERKVTKCHVSLKKFSLQQIEVVFQSIHSLLSYIVVLYIQHLKVTPLIHILIFGFKLICIHTYFLYTNYKPPNFFLLPNTKLIKLNVLPSQIECQNTNSQNEKF